MRHWLFALLILALPTATARAHFIWIVPDKDGKTVQVVFSDTPTPDDPKLLPKIAHTELFIRTGANGETKAVKWTEGKDAYQLKLPETGGCRAVGAVCAYDVVQRGKSEPFLLNYFAKYAIYPKAGEAVSEAPWDRLPLEILALETRGQFQVRWQGKPLADTEVVVLAPDADKPQELKTDAKGLFDVRFAKSGLYGFRVRHTEAKEGKHGDKAYKEIRNYSTLVFDVELKSAAKAETPERKADPAASKLLADARAARALWKDFPGFTADVEVNFDGKSAKGLVTVSAEGKVKCEGIDKEYETWLRHELASLVGHRLDSGTPRDTPCAFEDTVENHPLGRAIRVLNDELHSSYRIRGTEIVVVNRTMKDSRFTITVLESITNAERKYLTSSFVVDYWNAESGELVRSDAVTQTWKRVSTYDLPGQTRVISAVREKPAAGEPAHGARSINLTNHKLLAGATK